jgi:formate dehydrogenase iron-sulfur subunit
MAGAKVTVRVYISRDAAALALGADETAAALEKSVRAQGQAIELVRVGSRGMVWLEPLVEVEVAGERIGYGPVSAAQVESLLAAGCQGAAHALRLGVVDQPPFLAKQERLTFARRPHRSARSRPVCEARWLEGLRRALALSGAQVVQEVTDSGLRGRGGAAFPPIMEDRADQQVDQKYVVCNADEGDSARFRIAC